MLKKKISAYYNFLIRVIPITLIYFLTACANIVAPTGGPKDITPPQLLKSEPRNNATQFHDKQIRLFFDEFVQIKDANKNLLISPPVETFPEMKIKGRSVVLNFEDTFKHNTTYSIYFGQSIVDLSEGNPAHELRFVFSTGDVIDSLKYRGVALNAFTLQPEKDALIMLYEVNDDSVVYKQKPFYVTRADDNGRFQFFNLANRKYKLFGLLEKNGNYLYDQNSEEISFCDTLISPEFPKVQDTVKKDSLALRNEWAGLPRMLFFIDKDTIQRISRKYMAKPRQLALNFRQPVNTLEINPIGSTPKDIKPFLKTEFNPTRDTINIWIDKPELPDSLILAIKADGLTYDTLKFDLTKFEKTFKSKKSSSQKEKIGLSTNASATFELNQDFRINFGYPVLSWDSTAILLVEEKDTMRCKGEFTDALKRNLRVKKNWKENTAYQIIIPKGAFKDIQQMSNDTVVFPFKTKSLKDYGNLKIHLKGKTEVQYIVQLLDGNSKVYRETLINGSGDCDFSYLNPGKFKLKVIVDINKNGRWDTGRYIKKTQPEKVLYYPKELEIRSNWDLEEDWVF